MANNGYENEVRRVAMDVGVDHQDLRTVAGRRPDGPPGQPGMPG